MNDDNREKDRLLTKHVVIRLLILFIPAFVLIAAIGLLNSDFTLFALFAAYLSPIVGFIFLIIESFILQSRKKTDLKNINVILICVFLPIYILILVNHP